MKETSFFERRDSWGWTLVLWCWISQCLADIICLACKSNHQNCHQVILLQLAHRDGDVGFSWVWRRISTVWLVFRAKLFDIDATCDESESADSLAYFCPEVTEVSGNEYSDTKRRRSSKRNRGEVKTKSRGREAVDGSEIPNNPPGMYETPIHIMRYISPGDFFPSQSFHLWSLKSAALPGRSRDTYEKESRFWKVQPAKVRVVLLHSGKLT